MIAEPLTIVDAALRMRQETLTPAQLLEQCLRRIDRSESQVHAWVQVDRDGARATAGRLTDEARQGHFRGPLHGIPIGIKDIFDVAGMPTRGGSTILADRPNASQDAAIVVALRAAGAIILGKTVTTEFAGFDPPVTRNPWNLARTPGGSSSGSAAAVAARMCLAAIGSQTGGSITRPASFCGLASWKPTHGWLDVRGMLPQASSLDTPGPIAASVADLRVLASVLYEAGSTVVAMEDLLNVETVRPLPPRIAWLQGELFAQASPDIQAATAQAVEQLRAHGACVESVPLPACFAEVVFWHRQVNAAEAAFEHRNWYPSRQKEYGHHIAALVEQGRGVSAMDYQRARQGQSVMRDAARELLSSYDALLTPATVTTAPDSTTTGDSKFNAVWSYTGLPTVSVPCTLADDGLPAAVQLVGDLYGDGPLLQLAGWCDDLLRFQQRPALLTDI